MTKLKKYLLVVVLVLITGSGFLLYPKEKAAAQDAKIEEWTTVARMDHSANTQAAELKRQSSLVIEAIKQMIAAGIPPEKITFTGAQSSDDVFGSGKIDPKNLVPPIRVCYPSLCSGWKFLPAAKKNDGWYVYGVGTSATDIIAYLRGINPSLCSTIQAIRPTKNLAVNYTPPKQMGAAFDPEKPGAYSPKGGATTIKTEKGVLDGQPEGCFDNRVGSGSHDYIYYRVLLAQ